MYLAGIVYRMGARCSLAGRDRETHLAYLLPNIGFNLRPNLRESMRQTMCWWLRVSQCAEEMITLDRRPSAAIRNPYFWSKDFLILQEMNSELNVLKPIKEARWAIVKRTQMPVALKNKRLKRFVTLS